MSAIIQATLAKYGTLVDGSVKIELHTGEMVDVQSIHKLRGKYINVYMSEGDISDESAKVLDSTPQIQEPPKGKSPSQRLRSVIWIWWNQQGAKGEFNDFYDSYIEQNIQHIKDNKLDQ